jgi:hypothetical protein
MTRKHSTTTSVHVEAAIDGPLVALHGRLLAVTAGGPAAAGATSAAVGVGLSQSLSLRRNKGVVQK